MKEFETVSEIQILHAAWLYYLDRMLKEREIYKQMPDNSFTRRKYEIARARERELHDELLKFESEEQ